MSCTGSILLGRTWILSKCRRTTTAVVELPEAVVFSLDCDETTIIDINIDDARVASAFRPY